MLDFEGEPRLNGSAMTNSPMINLKRAVSYVRVSTRGQAERDGEIDGYSIPAQREANKAKALSLGAVVIKEFADKGASAKYINRPALQDMLDYVKDTENEVAFVIVHKLDRLARNREDDVMIRRIIRESGAKLISTTEGGDDTPQGDLMHGIFAAISEFYSKNLAREALKGMTQKVKKGGTVGKAPIGYKNIQYIDSSGREVRTVEVDKERAPFVTEAFKMYATGEWSICNLAAELAERGMTTSPTPRKPSKPIGEKSLNPMLQNPYYIGKVKFQKVYHDGKHEKLTDEITFRKVQEIMKDHINGERKRVNNHYLKSSVYCGECGSRLIIQVSRSKTGVYYPYFICIGRQSGRTKCEQKAVLIYEVEDQIAEYYKKVQFTDEFCEKLKARMLADIAEQKKQSVKERDDLRREQNSIRDKQKRVLQAYYDKIANEDMLREEQETLSIRLASIEARLEVAETKYEAVEQALAEVLELIGNCYKAYKKAPDSVRRAFNQAFFEKVYVSPNKEDGTKVVVSADLNEPFDSLTKNHRLFDDEGFSQACLVGDIGFEPMTSSTSKKRSSQLS